MSELCDGNLAVSPCVLLEDSSPSNDSDCSHPTQWLESLRTDDVEMASSILQSASTQYKDYLMNGDIPTVKERTRNQVHKQPNPTRINMEFEITKPLHAAAIFHSHAVLQLLCAHGVDVLQVDRWQNNAVHMLIYADCMQNARGMANAKTLSHLQNLFSEKDLTSLMIAENAFSLRPLEFAALHGCISMVGVIMQTKGIYLINEESVGYSIEQYIDLSDYELFDDGVPPRFYKSPLLFVSFIGTSAIQTPNSENIFDDPALKSWIHAKTMINLPFVFIWILFRFFYIGLFCWASLANTWPTIVINGSAHNVSSNRDAMLCSSQLSVFGRYQYYTLASISILILIFDFCEYIFMRKLFHPAVYKSISDRDFVAHVDFYRWMQVITCSSMVGITLCQILRSMGYAIPLTPDHICFAFIAWGCMWGVIYFLQVLPWISIYALAVQRTLQDFARFLLIFVIFLSAGAVSFRHVLLGDSNECPQNFDTAVETIYSTFLIIINLVNFREYENADKISLYILHIAFVFFISVLLINFLIATMTQSFSDVHAKQKAIINMQRLSLILTVQLRLAWPMQALYKRLHKRAFVYHNKRICLRRTLIKGDVFEPNLIIRTEEYKGN